MASCAWAALSLLGLLASVAATEPTCEAGSSGCSPDSEEGAFVQTRASKHRAGAESGQQTCMGLDHRNSNGHNIDDGQDTGDWQGCCGACTANSQCMGWTFAYNGKCYLKSLVTDKMQDWTEDNNVISYYKIPHTFSTCEGADHKNSKGTNIDNGVDMGSWPECCSKCTSSEGCVGWTYVYNGNQGKCYTKSSVSLAMQDWIEDSNAISGYPVR
jgi:hypothetical protein